MKLHGQDEAAMPLLQIAALHGMIACDDPLHESCDALESLRADLGMKLPNAQGLARIEQIAGLGLPGLQLACG